MKQVRGVNLGGWLVLEKWITPAVFVGAKASDEHSLVRELGSEKARRRLEEHRRTFITKRDIKQIRDLGLNTVRLPVGYWLFTDQDGFIGGSFRYVDKLFEWAREYNLQVIICLHGGPGSQNGNDHSGRKGRIRWYRANNILKSYKVIQRICDRYGDQANLAGVELINEPKVVGWWRRWLLFRYYLKAGRIVESTCHTGVSVVMSDAFQAERLLPSIVGLPLARPVVDTHMYQLFSDEDRALDLKGHIEKAKNWQNELEKLSVGAQVIVGEWSAAMDEMYDPVLKRRARSYTQRDYVRYARAQRSSFESARAGWIYWTARTEDGGVWSLLDHPEFIT